MKWEDRVLGAVLGHAVGDALGVPVEFESRTVLDADPVIDMRGYGTHYQPPGTWSDDTSLMLCLLELLEPDLDLQKLASNFVAWRGEGLWTPHGKVFDIGNATAMAISRLKAGEAPEDAGGSGERDNGNGSLMRILPVSFLKNLSDEDMVTLAHRVSCLTHRHPRSQMSCGLFVLLCRRILDGMPPHVAYAESIEQADQFYRGAPFDKELSTYAKYLSGHIHELPRDQINSSGYVVHTLEAAIWCLLGNDTYGDTVLSAVNLGEDTDTTGAVAGGLAGALYGVFEIPQKWLDQLVRKDDMVSLAEKVSIA